MVGFGLSSQAMGRDPREAESWAPLLVVWAWAASNMLQQQELI